MRSTRKAPPIIDNMNISQMCDEVNQKTEKKLKKYFNKVNTTFKKVKIIFDILNGMCYHICRKVSVKVIATKEHLPYE